MTTYLSRDFLTLGGTPTGKFESIYLTAIFLRRVMKYSYVGSTSLNIQSIGSILLGTGDTTPTGVSTWPTGKKAGINYGTGKEFNVGVPTTGNGGYTVSNADINRILVLRSTAYPKHNSGCFRIIGVDVTNNRFIIDWRSFETPPAEADDSIEWYVYAAENTLTIGAVSGPGTYKGRGSTATNLRIILQSGHATGWQVRLCMELFVDYNTNGTVPGCTFAPGFGGDGYGDFAIGGVHTHAPLWWDASSQNYVTGLGVGGQTNHTLQGNVHRISICADDGYQNVLVYQRYVSGSDNTDHGTIHFGIPDNEPSPTPAAANRIYVVGGCAHTAGYPGNGFSNGLANVGADRMQGTGYGLLNRPCTVTYGAWGYVAGYAIQTTQFSDPSASDSVWSGGTEFVPVELIAGTANTWWGGAVTFYAFPYEGRYMGTVPFLRQGRTNLPGSQLTTDKAWCHLFYGAYMTWGGPSVLP